MVNPGFDFFDIVDDKIGLDRIKGSCGWSGPKFESHGFMRDALGCPEELGKNVFIQGLILEVPDAVAKVYRFPERHPPVFLRDSQFILWRFRIVFIRLGLGMPEKRATPNLSSDVLCFFLEKVTSTFFHEIPLLRNLPS